jgi:hypothetical protein
MAAPIIYTDSIVPDFGLPFTPDVIAALPNAPVEALEKLKQQQEADPVHMGWRLTNWDPVISAEAWKKYVVHCVLGGNRCISGDTIVFDPVDKNYLPVSERQFGSFHVLTWDGNELVPAFANRAVMKAPMAMFRVELSESAGTSGLNHFKCTATHEILTAAGYVPLSSLKAGDELVSPWAFGSNGSQRILSIEPVGMEPVWDFSVPGTANYWCGGAIHHNSSKSALMARITLHLAMTIPGARIRCWSMNEESSVNDQQRVIWENLPVGYKRLPNKRNANYAISYSQKNGFTGGKLILPPVKPGYPGSEIIFQTYRSWTNDPQVAEGWWAHWIWLDEEAPLKLFETLLFRLYDARGRMGLSFTTLNGWTPLVADLLNGAKTIKKRRSSLVNRDLPIMQEARRARTVIHYFWTEHNAFIGHEEFLSDMANRPEAEKLARAHGVPTKSRANRFPLFSRDVHVVKHADIPVVKNPQLPVTWYTSNDPAGSKPWCMGWGCVDSANRLWILAEWPDVPTFGDWADAGGEDGGKPGPGQKSLGYGINDYVDVIAGVERSLPGQPNTLLIDRGIDPRMGASETQGENGAETIISRLNDKGLVYLPAPGKAIEDGEALVNDRLAYDQKRPVGADNSPTLFVSDRCENLIYALENYAGLGPHEPTKDPIDWLRYMLQSGVEFIDPNAKVVRGGGSY